MKELLSDEFASKLEHLAKEKAEEYKNNKPFPHIYFDDFLPLEAAEAALRDFPEPKELTWQQFDNPNERKLAFNTVEKLPTADRNVLYFLNSRPMLLFLETLTGIQGIIPDPYFVGGGLHQIKPGGKLGVHADFNLHDKLKLDRRINVLIYLNKDWKEEYGGHFELWNRDMTAAEQKILPLLTDAPSSARLRGRSTAIPRRYHVRLIAPASRSQRTTTQTAGRKKKSLPFIRPYSESAQETLTNPRRLSSGTSFGPSRLQFWPMPIRAYANKRQFDDHLLRRS